MVHFKVVIRVLGLLLFIESGFLFFSALVPFFYGESDWKSLLITAFISFVFAVISFFSTKNVRSTINKREGYLIVALVWVVFSVFGALPFYFYGYIPSYTDAFFETMSGFTTTGASILNDIEKLPHGLLFWRSLTQWIGGMGMILLSIAILPIFGIGGMQLYAAEVPGPTPDKFHPRVKETARRLWAIYTVYTLAETILLMIGGMTFFDAINHSFATMATGGYSTKQASVAYYDSAYIQYVIVLFMFIAGSNFSLSYFAIKFKFTKIFQNEEFRYYLGFTLAFTFLITLGLVFLNPSPTEQAAKKIEQSAFTIEEYAGNAGETIDSATLYKLKEEGFQVIKEVESAKFEKKYTIVFIEKSFRDALFQVVSIMTTTGFATTDYLQWLPILGFLIFVIMFFGGSAGSTGGGIKIVRIVVLFKNSAKEFSRLLHPNAVLPVRLNHRAVSSDIVANILAFIVFYVFSFVVGTLIISALGVDFDTSMGASIACLGNIGPGIGRVGPAGNFAFLPDLAKWILSFLMLIGRLELFTVLVIFTPLFWKK
jgi:trk system potassium uptake protein TrkH